MADGRTRYAVEIDGLAEFRTFVDREMATTLAPGTASVRGDLPRGQRWGGTLHSGQIRVARVNYQGALQRASENLAGYLVAGATMLEVIQRLMEMYRTAEEMATLTTEDVLRLFTDVAQEHAEVRSTPRAI